MQGHALCITSIFRDIFSPILSLILFLLVTMAQRLIKNLSSIQTEDFIAKTGILAELVVELHAVEQEENQSIIVNECCKVTA